MYCVFLDYKTNSACENAQCVCTTVYAHRSVSLSLPLRRRIIYVQSIQSCFALTRASTQQWAIFTSMRDLLICETMCTGQCVCVLCVDVRVAMCARTRQAIYQSVLTDSGTLTFVCLRLLLRLFAASRTNCFR